MSNPKFSKGPRNIGSPISTAEILYSAPLPAAYLNSFSSAGPVAEVGLLGREAIRVNGEELPITSSYQILAFNALAICAGNAVSSTQLAKLTFSSLKEASPKKITRQIQPFFKALNEAAGVEIVKVVSKKRRFEPVRFLQEKEPANELFNRLTEEGRIKFGKRVVAILDNFEGPGAPSSVPVRHSEPSIENITEQPNWRVQAACRGADLRKFFPEKKEPTEPAQRICRDCSARSECLEFAIQHDERFGIWGGLNEKERRALKRSRI